MKTTWLPHWALNSESTIPGIWWCCGSDPGWKQPYYFLRACYHTAVRWYAVFQPKTQNVTVALQQQIFFVFFEFWNSVFNFDKLQFLNQLLLIWPRFSKLSCSLQFETSDRNLMQKDSMVVEYVWDLNFEQSKHLTISPILDRVATPIFDTMFMDVFVIFSQKLALQPYLWWEIYCKLAAFYILRWINQT